MNKDYEIMKDSAWVRLIIMNIKYTKKNLSLIHFLKWPNNETSRLVDLAILENIFFLVWSLGSRSYILQDYEMT